MEIKRLDKFHDPSPGFLTNAWHPIHDTGYGSFGYMRHLGDIFNRHILLTPNSCKSVSSIQKTSAIWRFSQILRNRFSENGTDQLCCQEEFFRNSVRSSDLFLCADYGYIGYFC
jgi:hypothetical protein